MALGPVVGGVLVTSVGWRSIFWINIPIGLVAVVLALRYIPESKAPASPALRSGRPGARDRALGLADLRHHRGAEQGLVFAGHRRRLRRRRWSRWSASSSGSPGAREPLIDLRFFRSIPFSSATVIAVAAFAALGGFLFLNTLYLQDVRGLSPLQAGLDTLPMAVDDHAASPDLGADRRPPRGPDPPGRRRRCAPDAACLMLAGDRADHPVHVAVHGLRGLRASGSGS